MIKVSIQHMLVCVMERYQSEKTNSAITTKNGIQTTLPLSKVIILMAAKRNIAMLKLSQVAKSHGICWWPAVALAPVHLQPVWWRDDVIK